MTRALIQTKINEFVDAGKSGTGLLTAMTGWLDTQNLLPDEKKRIVDDLNSYEGFEWMSQT